MTTQVNQQQLLELLDNVTASLETCLLFNGKPMPVGDRQQCSKLAAEARGVVDFFLGRKDGGQSTPEPYTLALKTIPFIIERDGHKLTGRVAIGDNGVEIDFDNYGTKEMQPGYGGVVFAEPGDDGHPVIHIWACIAEADPTHSIALDEAAEHWRSDTEQPKADCHCEFCETANRR